MGDGNRRMGDHGGETRERQGIWRGAKAGRRGGGRWGGAAPVIASPAAGSAHRSLGPRAPFGQGAPPATPRGRTCTHLLGAQARAGQQLRT